MRDTCLPDPDTGRTSRAPSACRAGVVLVAAVLFSHEATPSLAADPQPSGVIQAEGGLLHDYRHASDNAFYYRLTYRGQVVRREGTPFDLPAGLNTSVAQDRDTTGDSGDFSLRLERGAFDSQSTLYDALGVKPIAFMIPSLGNLRGVAQANGQLEGGVLNLSAGVETPPAHPLRPLNDRLGTGITNWLIAGFQGQRRQRDSTGTQVVKESALFTCRAFFGRGFVWVDSRQLTGLNKELLRDALARAGSFEQALALRPELKRRIKDQTATAAENLIYLIAEEGSELTPAEQRDGVLWRTMLTQAATDGEGRTPPDQPTVALWAEGQVWKEAGRDRESDAWLNALTTTLRWWPDPHHPDSGWFSVIYANGYERAAPGARRDQLMVTFGLSF